MRFNKIFAHWNQSIHVKASILSSFRIVFTMSSIFVLASLDLELQQVAGLILQIPEFLTDSPSSVIISRFRFIPVSFSKATTKCGLHFPGKPFLWKALINLFCARILELLSRQGFRVLRVRNSSKDTLFFVSFTQTSTWEHMQTSKILFMVSF